MKNFLLILSLLLCIALLFCACEGKSAYDIAVENGFQGTEQEWLESLKGEKGDNAADENPQGLDFYPLPDGTWAVSAGKTICLEEVTIPEIYQGKAVTCIGPPEGFDDDACKGFSYAANLKKITIPNSIKYIGENAFFGCSSLESITIPSSVTGIGESVFYDCSNLNSVTFENKTGWKATNYNSTVAVTVTDDLAANATLLKSTYCYYTWTRE